MKVLYIQASDTDSELTRRVLRQIAPKMELDGVYTLAEAFDRLAGPVAYDVMLADFALPDGNGLDALRFVRERKLPLAVLILTDAGDHAAAVAAVRAGADDYLVKRDDYLHRLRNAILLAKTRFQHNTERSNRMLRVLHVEHDTQEANSVAGHVTQYAAHIRLTRVGTAQEALAALPDAAGEAAEFDVVLAAYSLPDMDGLELVKALREQRSLDIAAVLLAEQGSEDFAARALDLGVDEYLLKRDAYLFELPAVLEKTRQFVESNRERLALKESGRRLTRSLAANPTVFYNLRVTADGLVISWVSDNIGPRLGYTQQEAMTAGWWRSNLHPDDRDLAIAGQEALLLRAELKHDYRLRRKDGSWLWLRDESKVIRDAGGLPSEVVGTWSDISELRRIEALRLARQSVLDKILADQSLPAILDDIARRMEAISPLMRVGVLLLNPRTGLLTHAAGPSLPEDYKHAVDQIVPGEGVCSCGTAVSRGEAVIVSDVEEHPYWTGYRDLARSAGFRACWSNPFKDEAGKVLGTFAVYYELPREPQPEEWQLVDEFSRIAALAVQKVRAGELLRQAAAVFESTREGILVTDLRPSILAVNRAYTYITGYCEADVLGKNPCFQKSGRHDAEFFQTMWTHLTETGHWQGEIWNRRKSGDIYPQWLTINVVRDASGLPYQYVGVFRDLSQIKQFEARFEHLAHHDPLTDLPNRLSVQSHLNHALGLAARHNYRVAVLYLDLDRFKTINESLGHPCGDEVLILLAARLRSRLREEDTLARLGGDEFLLVLEHVEQSDTPARVAQSIVELLGPPFKLKSGYDIYLNASIGISVYPDDAANAVELVQHADMAMYSAKEEGGNGYRVHTAALSEAAYKRLDLETRLRRGLANDEFRLHYQMVMDDRDGLAIGVEALLRWQPAGQVIVFPDKFLPVAEETGLMTVLGDWMLHAACRQGKGWIDAGLLPGIMTVNLSDSQFQMADFVESVQRVLQDTDFPPQRLELELTGSMLMTDVDYSIATLNALKQLGVKLSVDGFGSGYSSLALLKRLPLDRLKIDQSFVRGVDKDVDDREIIATIIAMSRILNLDVLAKGVETEAQLAFLRENGCHYFQGFLFHKPEAAELLERRFGEMQA